MQAVEIMAADRGQKADGGFTLQSETGRLTDEQALGHSVPLTHTLSTKTEAEATS